MVSTEKPASSLNRLAQRQKPSELSRRLKPGTVLVREYGGDAAHRDGRRRRLRLAGKTYSSLSAVARR